MYWILPNGVVERFGFFFAVDKCVPETKPCDFQTGLIYEAEEI